MIRVDHLPAQDLLVVRPTGTDDEILVPFVAAIVPQVDIAAGRVIVTPPAGLFEDLPGDDENDAGADAIDATPASDDSDVER